MISKYLFSKQIKELTQCIEQFRQYRQMSKDQARMQSSFNQIYSQLIVNLQEQEFTNKKLINLSDKIERKVLYYLSNEEQNQVYQHLSNIYYHNLDISNPKQLAITIQYLGNINQIISVILSAKLNQEELYYTIRSLNIRNEWSSVEQQYIEKIKQSLDGILSEEIELDQGLFNQLIIASQSINIQSTLRRILKMQKLSNILQKNDQITINHLDTIIRIIGDGYLSITNWQLYQEQIVQLQLQTLAQQQFVYDHLNRYYQLSEELKELLNHPGLSKNRQSNIIINGILGKMEVSLDNLNSLNISNDIENCNLNDFCSLNRSLFQIKYDKHSDSFIYDYLIALIQEMKTFQKNNNYPLSEKFDQYIRLLDSLDGFYELKLQKKQIDPISEIYSKIEEEVFNVVCQNYFEIDLEGDQDPFAIDLLKQNKIKAGKWKEEEDQIKIKISTETAMNHTYQLFQITKLFSNNFKGRIYFYYAILKSIITGLKGISLTKQCEIVHYLTKIDKTYMLDSHFNIDYSQIQNLQGVEQLKCAIQLLFYHEITFNIEKNTISNLITIIHENLDLLSSLNNELQTTFFVSYKIMQIEFPSIPIKTLPSQLRENFENYWLHLQNEKEPMVQDTKKYMDKEVYHYTHLKQVDIWKFFFVFEENKTVVLCLSKRFYLGNTNLNLIEVSILKRVLRCIHDYILVLDYKLRILDRHEYIKLGTREAKNTYIYEKLKHLSREPKKPKKLYFNY